MNEMDIIGNYLDQIKVYEKNAWELRKYYQLLNILKEAKQLVKDLDEEISKINPDFSSLMKE